MNLVLIGGTAGAAIVLFALAWIYARKIDNYSIVDALWSLSFAIFALPIALLSGGAAARRFLFGGLVVAWSVRLGGYLAVRIFSHLDEEDRRYGKLRKDYGEHVAFRFFLFFMAQGLSVVLLLGPLFVAAANPAEGLRPLEILGTIVWAIGIAGEALADRELARFRKDPKNRGKVCELGLWNYSRHPNYFFESVIWLGYGLFALASPYGWATLYAPALIWFLLLKVTGVPYAEEMSLASKGDLYRAYQRTTSVFIPLPKRRP